MEQLDEMLAALLINLVSSTPNNQQRDNPIRPLHALGRQLNLRVRCVALRKAPHGSNQHVAKQSGPESLLKYCLGDRAAEVSNPSKSL